MNFFAQKFTSSIHCLVKLVPSVSVSRAASIYSTRKRHTPEYETETTGSLYTELKAAAKFSKDEWEMFARRLINKEARVLDAYVTDQNVDGVILRLCSQYHLFDTGKSYFNHLQEKKTPLTNALLSRYLHICSLNQKYALENKQEVIGIYQQLKNDVMEPNIAERCISVLCHYEDYWKDSFELLETVKKLANPTPSSYFAIIQACFLFGEIEMGWDVLNTICYRDFKPKPSCYIPYIDYCRRLKENGQFEWHHLERMFLFLEEHSLKIPSLAVVEKLDKFVHSLNDDKFQWSLKETFVPRNGGCSACRRSLAKVNITPSEFDELRKTFIKKAIVGSDVFLKTTPEEVEKFKRFLANSPPYDIVIDGLNVAYSRGAKRDLKDRAKTLESVVAHFVRMNKKILVLGRRHMKSWPKPSMDYIFNNARVFLALNLSQDDPFLLYAAMKGGPSTCLISRDLMRSHIFLIEDLKLRRLFRQWLTAHTYSLGFYNKFGVPSILPPLPYRPTAQKLEGDDTEIRWHLPYYETFTSTPPEKTEPPPKWLCITRIPRPKR